MKYLTSAVFTLVCLVFSLILANSPLGGTIGAVLHNRTLFPLRLSLAEWIDDGLMAIFFLTVAIELKRDLSSIRVRTIAYPLVSAILGMIVPALTFLVVAHLLGAVAYPFGWVVPTTTDIAFAVALLGFFPGLSPELRRFVLLLAVFDDLAGLGLLTFFMQSPPAPVRLLPLLIAGAGLALLNRLKIRSLVPWAIGFAAIWGTLFYARLFPELAGLAVGFALPKNATRNREHALETLTAWVVVPLFAFSQAFITLTDFHLNYFTQAPLTATALGLIIGKPLGILTGIALLALMRVPAPWRFESLKIRIYCLLGVSCVCGIGFTMSLLFGSLMYKNIELQNQAAAGVLIGSSLSALLAAFWLYLGVKRKHYGN